MEGLELSEVFFLPSEKAAIPRRVMSRLLEELVVEELFSGCELVAIKVHIGERGNTTYVHPSYVAAAVGWLRERGFKVFVTDTTTLYVGPRHTAIGCMEVAAENGFTLEALGAPFIVADGLKGEDGVIYRCEWIEGHVVEIARAFYEADAILVISHGKGHGMSGFGGAVKNLGMGCVTKVTKKYQHSPYRPYLAFPELCTGCGECVKVCAQKAVVLVGGKPVFRYEQCISCGGCVVRCPAKALAVPEDAIYEFNVRLGRVAAAVVDAFRKWRKPVAYINVAEQITKLCDCVPKPNEIVARDVGFLASTDPVAVDCASIDLIEENMYPEYGGFEGLNGVDPKLHLREASSKGAGEMEYRLVKL